MGIFLKCCYVDKTSYILEVGFFSSMNVHKPNVQGNVQV